MKFIVGVMLFTTASILFGCGLDDKSSPGVLVYDISDSLSKLDSAAQMMQGPSKKTDYVYTGNASPDVIVDFAETLIGVPYKYASTNPAEGFDCSGFITYVYNHFNIQVPRSSVDFTNVGTEINEREAKRGDLILFTGTDSTIRIVGHMGIVTENADTLKFIHATSGKQFSVAITPLSNYYRGRFVKVIRLG